MPLPPKHRLILLPVLIDNWHSIIDSLGYVTLLIDSLGENNTLKTLDTKNNASAYWQFRVNDTLKTLNTKKDAFAYWPFKAYLSFNLLLRIALNLLHLGSSILTLWKHVFNLMNGPLYIYLYIWNSYFTVTNSLF